MPPVSLSGAAGANPAATLPGWLQPFVRVNPLSYVIDLMRHSLLHGTYPGNLGPDYTQRFDLIVLVAFGLVCLGIASALFGEDDHVGLILLNAQPRKSALLRLSPGTWLHRCPSP